jgi:uncharacterized HAD superfamily protein
MIIGIDIDNVIGDTFQDLTYYIHKFIGKKIEPIKMLEFMRRKTLRTFIFVFKAWRIKLLTKISPINGAAATIQRWHPNHKIILITSRSVIFRKQTEKWLKEHRIPYHELHHAKMGKKYKRGKECNIFIEDNLEECLILSDFCDKVILFNYPWNQSAKEINNIIRVNSWEEISAIVEKLSFSPAFNFKFTSF